MTNRSRTYIGNLPVGDVAPAPAPWWQGLLTQAGTIASQVQTVKSAQAVVDINKQRLAQGLPPLTADQANALVPSAGVSVGLSPDLQRLIIGFGVGAGLLLLLWIVTRK